MDEIRYFMEESLISVEKSATVREASQKMRHHSISSILVSENGKINGVLTDIDLTRKFAANNMGFDTPVSTIANNPIITLDASRSMEDAYDCMRNNNIRHLGITENEEIVGILSIKDFANYYHNKYSNEAVEKGEIQYFMSDSILSIDAGDTVLSAAKKMTQKKVGCLIVSDAGKVKGIFSESALTMNVIAAGRPLDTTTLSSILTLKLSTMDCSQSMSKAYQKMRDNNIRHLSVSRGNKIIGMLSIKDFANYYNFKFCQTVTEEDQVGHYMRESLETIPESTSVYDAAKIMKKNKIGSLLINKNDKIAGIVTEEIFTRLVLGDNLNPETTLVSQLMKNLTTMESNQSMDSALGLMHQKDVRYLAVTVNNEIKGIISIKDITKYFKHKYVTAQDIGG